MSKIFTKASDGWFDFWSCKRCGHRQQLVIDETPLPDSCPECGYGEDIKEEKVMKYKCPICGKIYDKAADLADCVVKCENELNRADKEKEKEQAIQVITAKYDELRQLVTDFNKNYPNTSVTIKMTWDDRDKNTIKSNSYRFPNEFTAPLNFGRNANFDDLVKAFIGGDNK